MSNRPLLQYYYGAFASFLKLVNGDRTHFLVLSFFWKKSDIKHLERSE